MNRKFIQALTRGKWFIDPSFVLNNKELIANIITGRTVVEADDQKKSAAARGTFSTYNLANAPKGSVSFIPVIGSLFKEDQDCGPIGMQTMGNMLIDADNNPNISAHLLYIDSPGGTVDGTETFANIIKSVKKPVVAFVDGLMASAALWVGTSAKEVYASTEIDEIGSIGVLVDFMDVQPYFEKLGVKFHLFTADQSYDKVKMFEDLRAGKYQDYKEQILNPIADRFMSVVKANRPNVKDEMLHGKIYFAKDVVGSLIDGIKNIDQAVARAQELGREYDLQSVKTSPIQQLSNSQNKMKQFSRLNKVLGVETLESADGSVSLNEAQLQILETAIEQAETTQSVLTSTQEAKQKADSDLAAATQTITAQKQEIDTLKAAAAGGGAKEITTTDDNGKKGNLQNVVKKDASFMENLMAVEKLTKTIQN